MRKPLKRKIRSFGICKLDGSSNPPFGFEIDDVKSACMGLIEYHEEIIEDFIEELSEEVILPIGNPKVSLYLRLIEIEYEHLMNIQKWMEDAIVEK